MLKNQTLLLKRFCSNQSIKVYKFVAFNLFEMYHVFYSEVFLTTPPLSLSLITTT